MSLQPKDNGLLKAGIYARVSSTPQERDGTSLERQEEQCRAHAVAQGWAVNETCVYRETHTGAKLWERPKLMQLFAALREPVREVDVVICFAVDRLTRDQLHYGVLLHEAQRLGVRFEFVTAPHIDDSPVGKYMGQSLAFAAEWERTAIALRLVGGRKARVEKHNRLMPGGKPLYGYRWASAEDKGRLVVDPTEGDIVRRCFAEVAAGSSTRRVVVGLNRDGVPTPTGLRPEWNISTVAQMLHKPAYKGVALAWRNAKRNGARPTHGSDHDAIQLPDGTIPALVDTDVWDQVQAILTRNKARSIRNAKYPEGALLRGFVKCGYCGSTAQARPTHNDKLEYTCGLPRHIPNSCGGHSVRAFILDEAVWTKAQSILTDPTIITQELERLRGQDPTEVDLAAIDRMMAEVARQRTNLTRAVSLLDDADAQTPLLAQLHMLGDRQRALTTEREHAVQRQQSWLTMEASFDDLDTWCRNVSANLGELTYQQKRLALDALGFSVTLWRVDHDPRWVITCAFDPKVVTSTIRRGTPWPAAAPAS